MLLFTRSFIRKHWWKTLLCHYLPHRNISLSFLTIYLTITVVVITLYNLDSGDFFLRLRMVSVEVTFSILIFSDKISTRLSQVASFKLQTLAFDPLSPAPLYGGHGMGFGMLSNLPEPQPLAFGLLWATLVET